MTAWGYGDQGGHLDRGGSFRLVAAAAVAAFIFTIPFEEMIAIPGVGSVTRLVGVFAFLVGMAALVRRGRITLHAPLAFVLTMAFYTGWVSLTIFWSQAPDATLVRIITHAQLLAFVWLMSEFSRSVPRREALMQAFVLGNYVAFSVAAYHALAVEGADLRYVGRFDPNDFATVMALGIPMAALLATTRRHVVLQALNLAYPVVAGFGVVLAASRGGLVVAIVALMVVPFLLPRIGWVRGLLLFATLVAIVVSSWVYAPRAFPQLVLGVERLSGTVDELSTGTLTGRTMIWDATWDLFEASPLRGVGAGATAAALEQSDFGRAYVAHNAFLSVAASTGAIGFALFLALFGIALFSILGAPGRLRVPLLILCAALVLAMMPLSIEARKVTWFILGFLALHRPVVVMREGGKMATGHDRSAAADGE